MISLQFNRDYQCRLLINLLADEQLFAKLAQNLHLDDFELSACRLIYEIARDYHMKHHKLPPFSTVEFETMQYLQGHCIRYETQVNPVEYESVAVVLGMVNGTQRSQLDPNYFEASIQDFIMHARMLSIESQGLPMDQKLARIVQINEEVHRAQAGEMVFHNAMNKVAAQQSSNCVRYPTGMAKIDRLLLGGIARRQNGIVIAGTGVGKTNFFLNCHAESSRLNLLSLDIALEMEVGMLQERYQAMLAHIEAGWFADPTNPKFDPASAWRHAVALSPDFPYNDRFDIADYSAKKITVEEVRQIIIGWKEYRCKKGDNVDDKCVLVTLDYMDRLMLDGLPGVSKNSNDSDKLTKASDALALIAREQNVAFWTASQITKNAVGREVLDVRHAAHSFHRSDSTDIALGIAPLVDPAKLQQSGYGNDDQQSAGMTCDRQLNCSIMKARGTASTGMSDQTYQGPTLKYWPEKSHCTQITDRLRNKQDLGLLYQTINSAVRTDQLKK